MKCTITTAEFLLLNVFLSVIDCQDCHVRVKWNLKQQSHLGECWHRLYTYKLKFEAFTSTKCKEVFSGHRLCKCAVTIQHFRVNLLNHLNPMLVQLIFKGSVRTSKRTPHLTITNINLWDFKFPRRRVWSSDLSSGLCCRDDGGSMYLWNVGRQLFYTAVHPRRQIWTSNINLLTLFKEIIGVYIEIHTRPINTDCSITGW
jgi:hypothetical protein